MFEDRREAGRKLARELVGMNLAKPVVLALPRGGVPVGFEIAAALGAPLDVVVVRKVGAPGNPELAVGAIVAGDPPDIVVNREIVGEFGLDDTALAALVASERPELDRREATFRGARPAVSVAGRTAILVDDGAATGATMKVAARAIRRRSPAMVVIALPVAAPDTVADLRGEADRLVCLSQPARFRALSLHYRDFRHLDDAEVVELLASAADGATDSE